MDTEVDHSTMNDTDEHNRSAPVRRPKSAEPTTDMHRQTSSSSTHQVLDVSGTKHHQHLLPWDRFSHWVHCICVVTFDLELGQALEVVYPGHAVLTATEKANICYLAFPDSNSGCMGDTQFHFRMRRFSGSHINAAQLAYRQRAPTSIDIDPVYYFGFVHFRQTKDATVPRGYLQKSVVLITFLPLINLYSHVIETIALHYFVAFEPAIEAACHDIDQWPAPKPGETLSLPLMGLIVQCRIPYRSDLPHCNRPTHSHPTSSIPAPILLPTVHEPPLFETMSPILGQIQLIWELVLVGEPLVIMASSPQLCSSLVQSLVSLIWPLRYGYDYRPFFTIHDSEFREYTSRSRPPPNVILGVTNPFFTKTLQHWPHIVRVPSASVTTATNTSADKLFKKHRTEGHRTLDAQPGLYTQYRSYLKKDKALLKRIRKGAQSQRPVEVQSMILRRHFLEITQSFMIPLERYLASLMPLQRHINPFKTVPQARRFDLNEFLATITDANGPALTSVVKGDWNGLYRRFVESANFQCWLNQRRKEVGCIQDDVTVHSQVDEKLQLLHLDLICSADLNDSGLASRHEVELVDLVLKLRDKIQFADEHADLVSSAKRNRLQLQLQMLLSGLDADLNTALLSNISLRQTLPDQI